MIERKWYSHHRSPHLLPLTTLGSTCGNTRIAYSQGKNVESGRATRHRYTMLEQGMKPSQVVRKVLGVKGGRKYAPTRDWVHEVWRRYSS